MKIAKSVDRLGTEAVYNIFAETKKLIKQGKEIIDLSLGQSDFKSPKHAVDAAIGQPRDPGLPENVSGSRGRSRVFPARRRAAGA